MSCFLCSAGVLVTRFCGERGDWLSPDFSGCTLSSGDPQAFVIFTLYFDIGPEEEGIEEIIRANESAIQDQVYVHTYIYQRVGRLSM